MNIDLPETAKNLQVTFGSLKPIIEAIGGRQEDLLKRIKALEDRLPLGYAGTWNTNEQSAKGFFYTDRGSVWYCKQATWQRPGDGDHWQLAVKAGRDAR